MGEFRGRSGDSRQFSKLSCLNQLSGSGGSEKKLNSGQISQVERTECAEGSSGVDFTDDMFSLNVVVRGKDGWFIASVLQGTSWREMMSWSDWGMYLLHASSSQCLDYNFSAVFILEVGFDTLGNIQVQSLNKKYSGWKIMKDDQ